MTTRRILGVAAAGLAIGATLAWAEHANLERGSAAGKAFQVGELDSVSLFNGSATLALPLGLRYSVSPAISYGFTLHYNSNFWEFVRTSETVFECFGIDPESCEIPDPCEQREIDFTQAWARGNAGLGWTLSWGTLAPPPLWPQVTETSSWTYGSPDGSTHPFFQKLHEEANETINPRFWYSRDDSYLRLNEVTLTCSGADKLVGADVGFPDGTVHKFRIAAVPTCETSAGPMQLVEIADPYTTPTSNYVRIGYDNFAVPLQWTITDSQGRTQRVYFSAAPALNSLRKVDRIELTAQGPATATYEFHYADAEACLSCKQSPLLDTLACQVGMKPKDTFPFLVGITLPGPDGGAYCMGSDCSNWSAASPTGHYNLDTDCGFYPSGGWYCTVPVADRPGTLTKLRLPTFGEYEWTYQNWSNPTGGATCNPNWTLEAVTTVAGVASRTLTDPFSAVSGTWNYTHSTPGSPTDIEAWTKVTNPPAGADPNDRDESLHYFRIRGASTPRR